MDRLDGRHGDSAARRGWRLMPSAGSRLFSRQAALRVHICGADGLALEALDRCLPPPPELEVAPIKVANGAPITSGFPPCSPNRRDMTPAERLGDPLSDSIEAGSRARTRSG